MVLHAEVVRDGGDLVITWTGDEDVAIEVGPTPHADQPSHARPAGAGRAVVTGVDPSVRHYVRLQGSCGEVVVAAERRLAMDGTTNFRDLGGYRTGDGRAVRWGRVFRSDALHDLTVSDQRLLQTLGVRHICDLRREPERATAPHRLPDDHDITIEHLPIGGLAAETAGMATRVIRGEIREVGVEEMAEVYSLLLRLHADTFARVVERAADATSLPMVLHCTAGKDRTGVAAALILGALGIEESFILDDYELSHRYHSEPKIAEVRPQIEAAGVDFGKVEVFFGASRDVMRETLAELTRAHGGIEEYLTGPGGLDPQVLVALRQQLLA